MTHPFIPEKYEIPARQIIENERGEYDLKSDHKRYLMEVWLRYIEPHRINNGMSYEYNFGQNYSCQKCLKKCIDYFNDRFANE